MRVLLTTYGSRGDVAPVVGLALRLRELGAEARVCAPPDAEFAQLLGRAGVPLVPFGEEVRALVGTAGPAPTPDFARRVAAGLVAARFDTVGAAAEDCDVVLATGLIPVGVRSVAEHLGIRYVYGCFHPLELPSADHAPPPRPGKPFPPGETDNKVLWDLDAEKVDALYGDAHNSHRAALGLGPVENTRDHTFTDRPLLAADPLLGAWPGRLNVEVTQTGAWLLPDQRPLPADLLAFLEAGAPPVYVGFGSMPMRGAGDVARVAVDAVRAQGRRVLLSRGWADLAPVDDQDDCHTVGDVNHQALFRRVAAVVHHGGAGTTFAAARAGTPQVVVPQMVDQPYWASRVAELGLGAAHPGPVPTVDSLSAALTTALAPHTVTRARETAARIRTDGTTVAARMLLEGWGAEGAR